jgi:hypothetical protein
MAVIADQATRTATFVDGPNVDAFSRLRVSTPYTLFDSKQIIDSQPLFWDDQQTSGAGTSSTYLSSLASTRIDVAGNVAGTRVRQTFRRFNYQPGKSQIVLMTGILTAEGGLGKTGVTSRIGLFDTNNGLFFQRSGGTTSIVVRSFTSGAPVDAEVTQLFWNLDRLDGTGPSGITLDPTKTQIFVIDFQWLGAGRIRFGFDLNGIIVYCHQVLNANVLAVPFMQTPNLPLRYELSSAGTGPAATASLLHICGAVSSGGGLENTGCAFGADRGTSIITSGNDVNIYALLAIRYQAGVANKCATIAKLQYSVMSNTANATFRMGLLLNPTISIVPPLSYVAVANSALEAAVPAATNTITAGTGTPLSVLYESQNRSGVIVPEIPTDLRMGASIAGISDILVLFVQPVPLQGATSFFGSINWLEQV